MKRLLVSIAVFVGLATSVARATEPARRFDVAPFVGMYVPMGDQRDLLDDAVSVGLTASYDVHRYAAVVGSFSWTPTQTKALVASDDLDLFQYDIGVEGRYPFAFTSGLTVQPFVAVGAGARTYRSRDLDVDAETDFAGYVAAGVGAQRGPFTLRLGVRDNLTSFDGLSGDDDGTTRNDLGVFAGIGMRF